MTKKKKSISVFCLVDPMGVIDTTQEEEYKEIEKTFKRKFKDIGKIVFKKNIYPGDLKNRPVDMYVFDYGGMGMMGHADTIHSLLRFLLEAVENKPNTLFIMWSAMSSRWYKELMEDENKELSSQPNVIFRGMGENWADQVRDWFCE